eukprot:82966-Alexandrium_andersonii.AAC.1
MPLGVRPRALSKASCGLPCLTAPAGGLAKRRPNPRGADLLAGGLVEAAALERAATLEARVAGKA